LVVILLAFFIIGFENGIQFSVLIEAKETVADPTESLLSPPFFVSVRTAGF
jgi:hypothetical protein